jgi:hypothetical protein
MHGDALEVVIGHAPAQLGGVEVADLQPGGRRGHGHAGGGVRVHHAVRIGHMAVQRGVRREAGGVEAVGAVAQHPAFEVHLQQQDAVTSL